MADVDDRAAILAYHEATKHSPVSVRAHAHSLDWENRPLSIKVYTDVEGRYVLRQGHPLEVRVDLEGKGPVVPVKVVRAGPYAGR